MKNAKNIQKITTSLFLAATLVLGSVSFAVPGIMPSAFAATENLYVSADNTLFDKSFNGPMVIEIVVNDNDIDESADLEPDVTVNGGNLKMVQAGDGNWYAYIADYLVLSERVNDATTGTSIIHYGTNTTVPTASADGIGKFNDAATSADILYTNADVVVRQPKDLNLENDAGTGVDSIWPVIQAFEFSRDGSVTVSYAKGGNPQTVSITYLQDPDEYASFSLDRSSYPAGADVHMTIQSLAHNIDPTDEDSWTYSTDSDTVYYQRYNENGNENASVESLTTTQLKWMYFDDSSDLIIDANANDAENDIARFVINDDQPNANVTTQQVTILETEPNSGIFKNTDDGDTSNIVIADDAPRGYTATISFADSPLSVPIRNYPGSLVMDTSDIGGTWSGGEEIPVTLDDGDLNLNSLTDEDLDLLTWNHKIPTVIVGSPLTLATANFWSPASVTTTTYNNNGVVTDTTTVEVGNVQFVNGVDLEIDPFSHRAISFSASFAFASIMRSELSSKYIHFS